MLIRDFRRRGSPRTRGPRARSRSFGRPAAIVALALLIGAGGVAQEPGPLVTDRPDETESTGVVASGFIQLEVGWTVTEASDEIAASRTHTLPEGLVRIGVFPRLEARVGLPVWSSVETEIDQSEQRSDGFGDASLGLKLRLAEGGGAAPALALLAGATLPTGEEGFSSERVDPSFRLSFSSDFSDRLAVGWNVGLERATEAVPGPADGLVRDTRTELVYTLAAGLALTERLGAFLEGFGTAGLEASRPAWHAADGGFTFLVADNLQLDVRAGAGLDEDSDDWFLGVGASTRWPR